MISPRRRASVCIYANVCGSVHKGKPACCGVVVSARVVLFLVPPPPFLVFDGAGLIASEVKSHGSVLLYCCCAFLQASRGRRERAQRMRGIRCCWWVPCRVRSRSLSHKYEVSGFSRVFDSFNIHMPWLNGIVCK